MNQSQVKKENLWNQILNEQCGNSGFANQNLLILGRRGIGKRTLVDSLTEISKTSYPKRDPKDISTGKMKVKGSSSLLDYTYLNVVDGVDPENPTNARLNVYMFEEDFQLPLLNYVLNEQTVSNTFVVIALDIQEPWTFMDDLNRWVDALSQALSSVSKKLSLQTLDGMKKKIEDYVRNFREDEGGPTQSSNVNVAYPLREGVLKSNNGLPIMVVVTKSDIIEFSEKEKDWDSKFEVMRYCLRHFCITYGATLLFTSSKQNINMSIFYEYILHRLYAFPLKHKSDQNNGESLFIPAGFDDASILRSLFTKYSGSVNYDEKVPMPFSKKGIKEELLVEDNQEFFRKLKEKQGTTQVKPSIANQINATPAAITQDEQQCNDEIIYLLKASPRAQKQNQQLQKFFSKILNPNPESEKQLKESAQQELFSKIKGTKIEPSKPNPFNESDKNKIQSIINQTSQFQQQKEQTSSPLKSVNDQDTDQKIRNIMSLTKLQGDSQPNK